MTSSTRKLSRLGVALLGAGLLCGSAAAAQNPLGAAVPGDALSTNLKMLAQNPNSLSALMGAGRASLEVGDPQAALTFFGRAESLAPQDGRVKMWVGRALVQIEQPRAALRAFDEAASMGVGPAEFAGDRGLAFDMIGEPRRAQQDYLLALRTGADPEVTRRLSLSYAITGERERALQLLEPQLLARDRAAERTRAFVLALTGDTEGAARATQSSMGPQAAGIAPFLARLPSLSQADRALAVHFGHFPSDGSTQLAQAAPPPSYSVPAPATRVPAAPRSTDTFASRAAVPRTTPSYSLAPPVTRAPVTQAPRSTDILASRDAVQASPRSVAAQPQGLIPEPQPQPTETQPPVVEAPKPAPVPEPAASGLAEVAAAIAALDPEPEAPRRGSAEPPAPKVKPKPAAEPAAAKGKAKPAAEPAAKGKKAAAERTPPPPKEPSRIWVQIAQGAEKGALGREFTRLKGKAGTSFGARGGWTAASGATNRLLVGPFKSDDDAQAFVNALKKGGLGAFAWTSAAGQKIDKLGAK
jgi:Flp pilus assembly protein TadD